MKARIWSRFYPHSVISQMTNLLIDLASRLSSLNLTFNESQRLYLCPTLGPIAQGFPQTSPRQRIASVTCCAECTHSPTPQSPFA